MTEYVPGVPGKGQKTIGAGRTAGTPNKVTQSIRDALKQAFEERGGVDALKRWADESPDAFYALVGKLIPTEITGAQGGPVHISVLTSVPLPEDDGK